MQTHQFLPFLAGLFLTFSTVFASPIQIPTIKKRIASPSNIPTVSIPPIVPGRPPFVCGCTNDCILNCKKLAKCICPTVCDKKYLCTKVTLEAIKKPRDFDDESSELVDPIPSKVEHVDDGDDSAKRIPVEAAETPKPKTGNCWQECIARCPKNGKCNCLAVQCPGLYLSFFLNNV